ncbi:MAG: fibronectin type III domain-containing protein, partial [Bacteroidales bacterium]|nr:fibronectin type III domain-containing protein [Bacteroidales bacterium]
NPPIALDDIEISVISCSAPSALTSSAITATSANISWTAATPAPANGYEYEVRTTGAAGSGGTGLTTTGTTAAGILTANVSPLLASTTYYVYVRSVCSGVDNSAWSTVHSFPTQTVAPVPYLEPFTTTTTPNTWNITGWTIGSTRGVTGNPGNNIYKNIYYSGSSGATFTTINIGTIPTGAKLTFDYKLANYNSPYAAPAASSGNFSVSLSTDYGANWTVLETITNNGTSGWQIKEYDLASYVGEIIKISFIGNWTSGDYDLAFDNIKVDLPPHWTGAISSNWTTSGNWSYGIVPTGAINALIPGTYTNAPVINADKITPAVCNNLTIAGGAILTIAANKALTVNGNLINNGIMNIQSTTVGDGSLLTIGALSGTGTYNVDRYLQESMWHLVSSPITSSVTGVYEDIWLRAYDEATNSFGAYIVPTNIPMPVGQGYSVWTNTPNEIRTYTGDLNTGAIGPLSLQLTGTAGDNTGWNLIGNPYPSAIDWNAASGWNKTNIGGVIYLWDNDQYVTWNGTVGTLSGSRYIAPEQGFFVQATSSVASISLNNNVRLHNSIQFRDAEVILDLIRVKVEGNQSSDEAVLYYVENADDTYDFNSDAAKLYGSSSAPQIYTKKQDNMLAINAMSNLDYLDGKLVYLEVGANTEYMINYSHSLVDYSNILLKDLSTNAIISPNYNYVFTAQTDDDPARFKFFLEPTDITEDALENTNVWAFNNILYINTPEDQVIDNVSLYTVQGQLVMQFKDKVKDLTGLAPAMYVVKVNAGTDTVIEKIIVK